MPLTDVFLKNLKLPAKPAKYRDGGGMYLYSTPTGLKSAYGELSISGRAIH
jgi:hypothetical protein